MKLLRHSLCLFLALFLPLQSVAGAVAAVGVSHPDYQNKNNKSDFKREGFIGFIGLNMKF